MRVSKVALSAMLAVGGSALLVATPGTAQSQQKNQQQAAQPPAQQPQRQLNLSRAERTALGPLSTAVQARDWAAAQAALPAAQAAAQGADARYALGQLQLNIGVGTNNAAMQMDAIDAMISSGSTPAEDVPTLLRHQASLAYDANDLDRTERALDRLVQATPNDADIIAMQGQVARQRGNNQRAVQLFQRALEIGEAAGRNPPENRYKLAFQLAYQTQQRDQALDVARRLVSRYPTPVNWRDALTVYRAMANPDAELTLDTLRLMRAARALNGQRDYMSMIEALNQGALSGEALALIDEGIAAGMLERTDSTVTTMRNTASRRATEDRTGLNAEITAARGAATGRDARRIADALFGYNRLPEAVELYRLALTKGGEDANLVNTRLGAALALAGQRAEAEQAFRAVTGPRAELAGFWLAWLASPRPTA